MASRSPARKYRSTRPKRWMVRRGRLSSKTSERTPLATKQTDSKGNFTFDSPKEVVADLRIEAMGFGRTRCASCPMKRSVIALVAAPMQKRNDHREWQAGRRCDRRVGRFSRSRRNNRRQRAVQRPRSDEVGEPPRHHSSGLRDSRRHDHRLRRRREERNGSNAQRRRGNQRASSGRRWPAPRRQGGDPRRQLGCRGDRG